MTKKDLKVLIVDDDQPTLMIIRYSLSKIGYSDVSEAPNGQVAMGVLEESNDYDLIISDFHMPKMDGLQLLKAVRNYPAYKDVPFIMLTSDGALETITDVVKARVSSYVVKPFTPEALEEKINGIKRQIANTGSSGGQGCEGRTAQKMSNPVNQRVARQGEQLDIDNSGTAGSVIQEYCEALRAGKIGPNDAEKNIRGCPS